MISLTNNIKKVTCSLTASRKGARISSMLPSMVRPSASCTHRRWFLFLYKQTDVETCLFWVLLPRDRRASRTVDTGQRERSSVLVRSSADAALRSMDRCNKRTEWWNRRNQVNVVSASRWHFRQKRNLTTCRQIRHFIFFILFKNKIKKFTRQNHLLFFFFLNETHC